MMSALDAAFAQNSMPLFFGEPRNTAFQRLARGLDVIAAEHHFGELAQSCGRATSRCFLRFEHEPYISDECLEHKFAGELILEIIGRSFFPIVRERILENTGRDSAAQRIWEDRVTQCITENPQSFSRAIFAGNSHRGTKRHVRSVQAPSFDWSRLTEPLHVLGA
jgi:hypothetical protein